MVASTDSHPPQQLPRRSWWLGHNPQKTWILQANPDKYHIDEALDELAAGRRSSILWRVGKDQGRRKEVAIARGQRVLVWRSQGTGKTRSVPGIVAIGRVLNPPIVQPYPENERVFLTELGEKDIQITGPLPRFDIELVPTAGTDGLREIPAVNKNEWDAIDRLREHDISYRPFSGTVFRVGPETWELIAEQFPILAEVDGGAGPFHYSPIRSTSGSDGGGGAGAPEGKDGLDSRFTEVPFDEPTDEPRKLYTEAEERELIRQEALLVKRYRQSLDHDLNRYRLYTPAGMILTIDAIDEERGLLIEAKSGIERSMLREALGQVLDYCRFMPSNPHPAILVPERPIPELLDLFHAHGITVIFETEPRSGVFRESSIKGATAIEPITPVDSP